tara:strand:- start:1349 stop:2137 length:789 start_codon:yes stop_codon:yes gene_type:complete
LSLLGKNQVFELFSDRARKVMAFANQEAQDLNHEYIGTEHILAGLIKEGTGVAHHVLDQFGITYAAVQVESQKLVRPGPNMVTMGRLPQSPRAKKMIEYAIEEVRKLEHSCVGTEHLLLGLLREHEGVGAQILMNLGKRLDEIREYTLEMLGQVEVEVVESTAKEGGGMPCVRETYAFIGKTDIIDAATAFARYLKSEEKYKDRTCFLSHKIQDNGCIESDYAVYIFLNRASITGSDIGDLRSILKNFVAGFEARSTQKEEK